MFELAQDGHADFVIDLGSGDGRIDIAAIKHDDARAALGVEIDPAPVALAKRDAPMSTPGHPR